MASKIEEANTTIPDIHRNPDKEVLEDAANKLANKLLEKVEIFNNDDKLDLFVKAQAKIFWCYKDCKDQDEYGQLEDFYSAKSYLGYLLSGHLLKACDNSGQCLISNFSSATMQLLQFMSISQFVNQKAYMRWLYRSGKKQYSTQDEYINDYLDAEKIIRKGVLRCIGCPNALKMNLWKAKCTTSVFSSHAHFVLLTLKKLEILDYRISRYVASFTKALDLFLKEKEIPWELIQNLLLGIHNYPQAISMFEVLLIRAMITKHLDDIQSTLSTKTGNVEKLIQEYAWINWFNKGCPENQSNGSQLDDYCHAKRYVACIIADNIFKSCKVSSGCYLQSLNEEIINILLSVSLEEYENFDYCKKSLLLFNISYAGQNNDKSNSMLSNCICKRITTCDPEMYSCTHKKALALLRKQNIETVKKAKENTLMRLNKKNDQNIQLLDAFITYYYSVINTENVQKVENVFIKDNELLIKSKSVINLLEFIAS
jgi:hypothetical protein